MSISKYFTMTVNTKVSSYSITIMDDGGGGTSGGVLRLLCVDIIMILE